MSEKKAYTQAFQTGKYDKATGLLGKYDNVRRFWEDQVTWRARKSDWNVCAYWMWAAAAGTGMT
ncbi:MAG: hypothetical protein JRF71_16865 [Deltaproteobacteria bacterium]|nr:hypothetical protein [Deltaproteobacteria bacterium]